MHLVCRQTWCRLDPTTLSSSTMTVSIIYSAWWLCPSDADHWFTTKIWLELSCLASVLSLYAWWCWSVRVCVCLGVEGNGVRGWIKYTVIVKHTSRGQRKTLMVLHVFFTAQNRTKKSPTILILNIYSRLLLPEGSI